MEIFFTVACIIAVAFISGLVLGCNKTFDNQIAPGWWIIAIGIDQMFVVAILSVWWPEWWGSHQWIMITSVIISIVSALLWAIAKARKW